MSRTASRRHRRLPRTPGAVLVAHFPLLTFFSELILGIWYKEELISSTWTPLMLHTETPCDPTLPNWCSLVYSQGLIILLHSEFHCREVLVRYS